MTDKLFDDFVKSKLEHYDSGAPMNVWERIKKDKEDDPKGIFFWSKKKYLLLLGVILIASSTGFLLLKQNTNSTSGAELKKSGDENSTVINQTTNTTNSSFAKTNTSKSSENSIKKETTSSGINASRDQFNLNEKNSAVSKIEPRKTSVQNYQTSATLFSKTNNRIANNSIKKESLSNRNSVVNQNNLNTQNVIPQNILVTEQVLSLAGHFHKSNLQQFKLGNIAMPDNKPSCPTINGPRRKDLYLEIYAGPDYNVRTLSSTSVPAGYVRERNDNENYRTSFSAGVRLVKNLGEKTLIKTGVNYSQINERLRLVAENSKQQTQVITIRTVVRAPGDTLFIRDTMYYEQNGTRYRTTYNRYRFVDVPLIFSYEFGNPDLMHFSINAGAVFNITSFYGGEVLDTSYKPIRISTSAGSNANNWRSNIGIGVFASMSLYKKLNDRIHLFAEPYVRYNLNPVTQANSYIKQRYLISGMQLGMRYNLIKPGQRYR